MPRYVMPTSSNPQPDPEPPKRLDLNFTPARPSADGVAFGSTFTIILSQSASMFGRRALPVINSLLYMQVSLGSMVGQMLVASLHKVFPSYALAFGAVTLPASAVCLLASTYLGACTTPVYGESHRGAQVRRAQFLL